MCFRRIRTSGGVRATEGAPRAREVASSLSPFRLPRTLKVSSRGVTERPMPSMAMTHLRFATSISASCRRHAAETTAAGIAPMDTVIGPVRHLPARIRACLVRHARRAGARAEEDAADQVAADINLQFCKAEARQLIMGIAYAYASEAERAGAPPSLQQFADEHGTPAQRAYDVLCIAYGADPELFGDCERRVICR